MPGSNEEYFIKELLDWDSRRRGVEWLLCNTSLILGGAVLIGVLIYTLRHLQDELIFRVTVPGSLIGLYLVGLYMFGRNRIRERQKYLLVWRNRGSNA